MKVFISGNEAALRGALAAGAKAMYGYPITPSTEIMHSWAEAADKNDELIFLQTEDETSAGFAVNGSVLMGAKSFTATAGPGTVLMQDPLSMAENLRLPTVTIVMQRGGPSTGTVNYSQQEVMLSAFGGNGEGLRIVYSAGNPQEMYDFVIQAFDNAWHYRFPTLVLGDGYIGKQKTTVELKQPLNPIKSVNLLAGQNIRNCYSSENQFAEYLEENIEDFEKASIKIAEYSLHGPSNSHDLIIAHGSTFYTVLETLKQVKRKYQLFRPITLRPFPASALNKALRNKKNIYIFESAYGQLNRLVKEVIDPEVFCGQIIADFKPAKSYVIEEILNVLER